MTWLYVAWSLLPVLIAIQFSFNDGRSRSTWQGFSTRWYWGDPGSVAEDPSLRLALSNSLSSPLLTTLIATPLGVALALGLARWRGRASRAANGLMLLPLATPEIVMGGALYLVFTNLYTMIPLGRTAQLLGHVTFSVSYVVVIVRARLQSIGPEYEAAARDLGASPGAGPADGADPAAHSGRAGRCADRVRRVHGRLRHQRLPLRRTRRR